MNSYEMSAKTPISNNSQYYNSTGGGRGNSMLSNMRTLIVNQDNKIQEKLRALNDWKDSFTLQSNIS